MGAVSRMTVEKLNRTSRSTCYRYGWGREGGGRGEGGGREGEGGREREVGGGWDGEGGRGMKGGWEGGRGVGGGRGPKEYQKYKMMKVVCYKLPHTS